MPSAPQAERAAEAKDSGTGGVTFAELEVVSVSGIQKVRERALCVGLMKLRSHGKDFCLCPKSNGWEMSFIVFYAGNDDQFCSGTSPWKWETHKGPVAIVQVGEALRAPSPGTCQTPPGRRVEQVVTMGCDWRIPGISSPAEGKLETPMKTRRSLSCVPPYPCPEC